MVEQASPTVITLVSGKGGTGKTTLSLALALLLSESGSRTLLIDFDLSTHGATYFFLDRLKSKIGLIELAEEVMASPDRPRSSGHLERLAVEVSETFSFVGSQVNFSRRSRALTYEHTEQIVTLLERILEEAKESQVEFVILDTQAGPEPSSFECAKRSDKVIIVAEADPVSIGAVRSLDNEMGERLPSTVETYFLLNKMPSEEIAIYEPIRSYLRYWKHLPPLLADRDVVHAFMQQQIPIRVEEPSPFLYGMVGVVKALLPERQFSLPGRDLDWASSVSTSIHEQLQDAQEEINLLETQLSSIAGERRGLLAGPIRWVSSLGGVLSIGGGVAWVLMAETLEVTVDIDRILPGLVLMVGGVAVFLVPSFLGAVVRRGALSDRANELRDRLADTIALRRSYQATVEQKPPRR